MSYFKKLKQKWLLPAVTAISLLVPNSGKSYEAGSMENPNCHPVITSLAMDNYNNSVENENFRIPNDLKTKIIQGSIDEDTPPRYLNHFMDWQTGEGIWGFSSALEWALSSDAQSGMVLPVENVSPEFKGLYQKVLDQCNCANYPLGDKSWNTALSELEQGIYSTALGHVLHLVGDMTVGAHTRGDVHVLRALAVEVGDGEVSFSRIGDLYEYYLSTHLNLVDEYPSKEVGSFNSLEEIFVDASQFTGKNFFSDDTIGTYNSPNLDSLNEEMIGGIVYKVNIIDGKKVRLLRQTLFGWGITQECIEDYASVLIPRAKGYAAEVLRLAMETSNPNCVPKQNYTECYDIHADGLDYDVWWFNGCGQPTEIKEDCNNNQDCENPICIDKPVPCSDECYAGQKQCSGDYKKECGDYDSDECLEWSELEQCVNDTICNNGECICVNDCNISGLKSCEGNSAQLCTDVDGDTCLEKQDLGDCGTDHKCIDGKCIKYGEGDACDPCVYEAMDCKSGWECKGWLNNNGQPVSFWCRPIISCNQNSQCGESYICFQNKCVPGMNYICSGNDIWWVDVCGTWVDVYQSCNSDQKCENGTCVNNPIVCSDDCSTGEKTCDGNGWKQCGSYDTDSCKDWSSINPCSPNYACADGKCNPVCLPDCSNKECGEDSCGGSCGECSVEEICDNGECVIPACEPTVVFQTCNNGDVYMTDNCGELKSLENKCSTFGPCVSPGVCGCLSHNSTDCKDNDVYYKDSCYNFEEKAMDCGTGSCANGQCSNERFVDKSNGTVLDNVTGFYWQKTSPATTYNFNEAINYCDNLSLGGSSSWSLPNYDEALELNTIIAGIPAINDCMLYPIFNGDCGKYWTSTTGDAEGDSCSVSSPAAVDFNYDNIGDDVCHPVTAKYFVRCKK